MKLNSQSPQINFQAKIRFVDAEVFCDLKDKLPKTTPRICDPYTAKEIIRAKTAYTTDIYTCTAGGVLVKDKRGKADMIMFHLCPPDEQPKNVDFSVIKDAFFRKNRWF